MDRTDLRILDALQQDGRQSNQALADRVGISTAACWRRVRALEEEGVIERYAALLSRPKLGLDLCAFVHISLARHVQESTVPFEQAVMERPEVMECFATTGDADFILRVVTTSIEAFDKFLEQFLFGLPQVSQVRSNIALRELKLDTALALPLDRGLLT
ncbi:MAG: winged helix-turn-helix transcriptional regulator [Haliea sp.]|jgi:DNA-binding Lrp family transcriptional regulator|nr:winged helix-turn-helix transcriptional regulator [Haliea sp.]